MTCAIVAAKVFPTKKTPGAAIVLDLAGTFHQKLLPVKIYVFFSGYFRHPNFSGELKELVLLARAQSSA